MSNYYCLMTGVPSISLDQPSSMSYAQFREECEENLTAADKKLLSYSYLRQDCLNLVKLLQNPEAQLSLLGNYSETQLRELIAEAQNSEFKVEGFPEFLADFIRHSYAANAGKADYFADDAVMLAYYEYAMSCKNEMIAEWFKLNFTLSNILTALIARQNGWNVADYVRGENEVNDMIKSNKSKDFDLSREYDFVAEIMKIVDTDDPVEKEKKIDAFKWLWLDEKTFFEPFNIEAVFAYLCKLEMQLRWEMLDPEKGKETFTEIIENLRSEAKVPAEFVR
ncbi:MAG: DUF2764 domain-containing protein [Bacteroidaceae bacterium]|nr:DUF2764 domain-containing protein [Bacteroidaceae bacterium]